MKPVCSWLNIRPRWRASLPVGVTVLALPFFVTVVGETDASTGGREQPVIRVLESRMESPWRMWKSASVRERVKKNLRWEGGRMGKG